MPGLEDLINNASAYAEGDLHDTPNPSPAAPESAVEESNTAPEVVEEPQDHNEQQSTPREVVEAAESVRGDDSDNSTTQPQKTAQDATQSHSEGSEDGKDLSSTVRSVTTTDADIIIKISNGIETLSDDERLVTQKLITPNYDEPTNGELVVAVMNASRLVKDTIQAVLEAKDLDPVERAFFVVEMPYQKAVSMASMVSAFEGGEPVDSNQSQVDVARQVVAQIDRMSKEYFSYIQSTRSLLDFTERVIQGRD